MCRSSCALMSSLSDGLSFCSDGAVKRLGNEVGSIRYRLRHGCLPLLRLLCCERTQNSAVRKLRLRRVIFLRGRKLRPYLDVCHAGLTETPVQTGIGTPVRADEPAGRLHFVL